ncbi:2,3-diketo-5-methylthio-1-phosphopentane phosphatase [Aulographum hederae CBS 113979]|uniref:2,3-diketo-5-methylthio-1-phosphopentane phosphatase n=1 Tax=Aulographum hederae CBS 113979 TaxID=1176131 RepID=A0A6G1HCW5_9PEZI|nr:2,3-diketo-5-methylthio-1-phosphopentane phosphatase [Aulographum hederae CBS 113979]
MPTQAILLDIEGTICPVSFVHQILFPYALQALPAVLQSQWDSPAFLPYKSAFPEGAQASPKAFSAHVADLTARDVKIAYLKNLQGYLWRTGYESKEYATPLFADVVPWLEQQHAAGKKLAIFSSGSVEAQKLLFQYVGEDATKAQDINGLFEDRYFDTVNAGPKAEKESYGKIAEAFGVEVGDVTFYSDNVKEIDAAEAAGMVAILVNRPGNAPVSDEDMKRMKNITSFDQAPA